MKNYANFNGRAHRKEFWMFYLVYVGLLITAELLDMTLRPEGHEFAKGLILNIYVLIMFLPYMAISVRRLHDIDKSGWMWLLNLIPLVGYIWLLILFAKPGEQLENGYGEDPLAEIEE